MFSEIVVFSSYAIYVIMSFMMMVMIFMMLPRAQVSAARIEEVLASRPRVREGEGTKGTEKGSLSFRNVSFRYADASEDCLQDISFDVRPGETVAFIGATGSGKTTLVSLAARSLILQRVKSCWMEKISVRIHSASCIPKSVIFHRKQSSFPDR